MEYVPRPFRIGTFGLFLAVLFVVLAIYTEMAFEMEWTTEAGRIGPGFFPRIVGTLGMIFTAAALWRELRMRTQGDSEADGAAHPFAVCSLMVAAFLFAYWFLLLGALISGVLFLAGVLWFLDPERRVRAVLLGIALPLGMFLVLQTGLNAGLPDGLLPLP